MAHHDDLLIPSAARICRLDASSLSTGSNSFGATATPRGQVRDEAQRIVDEAALCQTFFDAVPKFPSW